MRTALLCAAVAVLVLAAGAAAALPRPGVLVPATSLGGVRLGEPAAQVRAALGAHGVCRGCLLPTWYFTYRRFDQHGLGVELVGGRVSAVYTLWQPHGWRTPGGLVLGTTQSQVTAQLGTLLPVACAGYSALVSDARGARTAYYIRNGRLWGFGLLRAKSDPCR
ncbi:MAG TPA: hypothetical protein VMB53_13480 [Gaiellaceae bacterium]|nr:hypothetical protein [Gaiellaceae bacterium]